MGLKGLFGFSDCILQCFGELMHLIMENGLVAKMKK
jgi:hypothetical protein